MPRTVPTPAMPMGAKFNAEAPLLDNAAKAWEYEQERRRSQRERNAKVLARRVFRTDELSFSYDVVTGLDVPTFEIESELILYNNEDFSLIEFCSACGKNPKGRRFGSLAGFGRVLAERDADDAYTCQICTLIAGAK